MDKSLELDSHSSFYYLALSMMMREENSVLPEIMYILNPEQIKLFLDMFGGTTLRVPTREEFATILQAALVTYRRFCEGMTTQAIQDDLNIDGNKMRSINQKINSYLEFVRKEGLLPPDILRGFIDVRYSKN